MVGALDASVTRSNGVSTLPRWADESCEQRLTRRVCEKIVQSPEYRDAKRRRPWRCFPSSWAPTLSRSRCASRPRWRETPVTRSGVGMNNPYVVTRLAGFGTRARLDTGQSGISAVGFVGRRTSPSSWRLKRPGSCSATTGSWSGRPERSPSIRTGRLRSGSMGRRCASRPRSSFGRSRVRRASVYRCMRPVGRRPRSVVLAVVDGDRGSCCGPSQVERLRWTSQAGERGRRAMSKKKRKKKRHGQQATNRPASGGQTRWTRVRIRTSVNRPRHRRCLERTTNGN